MGDVGTADSSVAARGESDMAKLAIATVEEIIDEARNGRMFILVDDEDRENEGDLVIPAQMATPDAINFMATHGRGLICLALPAARIDALGLPLMAASNSRITCRPSSKTRTGRQGVRAPLMR